MKTVSVFIFPHNFGGFVQSICSSPDGLFNLCHVTLSAHTSHRCFYSRQQQHAEMLMSLFNSLAIYKGQSLQKTKVVMQRRARTLGFSHLSKMVSKSGIGSQELRTSSIARVAHGIFICNFTLT